MPYSFKRQLKRRIFYGIARARYLVDLAYADIIAQAAEDEGEARGSALLDPHSVMGGQFEVAANGDHTTQEVYARPFGFGPPR